jgi:fatty-acyl-CoA synthase
MSNPLPAKKEPSASKAWLRALELTARIEDLPLRTFPAVVAELGARHGAAPALIGPDETLSHAGLAARANRVSRWARAQGIAKGDTVCLFLPNSPDYLALWLGLTRIGAVAALLNINLRGAGLSHCIAVSGAGHIIAAESLADALDGATLPPTHWWQDALRQVLDGFDDAPLAPHEQSDVTLNDPALLIYTSGTTGLPKAAHVSHRRVMSWTHWFAGLTNAGPDDRLYNCLPMYHSVGGVVASGAVLVAGGAVICREKFSASRFWQDVADTGATIFQYIGELCRYLLAGSGDVPAHRLRLAVGNGLSADVWEAFQARCAIPQILEFYAATEGNFSLYNVEGKPGAIGRIPGFLAHRFPTALIRMDGETPVRGPNGLCQAVSRGEAGEAIGKIAGGAAQFEGYTDAGATEKKILRDVFAPGDAWVRSGDLMRQDAQGFFYFVDRIGDTFRWKGENVATTEVAAAAASAPGVAAANVYGVAVPGQDGEAGMAALEVTGAFDLAAFHAHIAVRLPPYARPLFLRIVGSLAITETFKQKKHLLARDGFDPAVIADPLYADLDGHYVALDAALYARISTGLIRL